MMTQRVHSNHEDADESSALAARRILAFLRDSDGGKRWAAFSKLTRISDARAGWSIARQWLAIAGAVWFALHYASAWSYLLAAIVIATRQHALMVLMHEATHNRLFSARWANDGLGDLLCALPTNMTVRRYRHDHLLHHKHNMTDGDPYFQAWRADDHWSWPKPWREGVSLFVKDLAMMNMGRLSKTLSAWSPWANHLSRATTPVPLTVAERLRLYAFLIALAAALTWAHAWLTFALLWVLPLSTLVVLFARIRSVAEHLNMGRANDLGRTRHVDGHLLERWTVAPLNINIHLAHHLFPSVPQYHLPALHRLLLEYPDYAQAALYDSYLLGKVRVYSEMIAHGRAVDRAEPSA